MRDQSIPKRVYEKRAERVCVRCGVAYWPSYKPQQYCSLACANLAKNEKRHRPSVVCPQCGKSFYPKKGHATLRCSKACTVAYEREHGRDGNGRKRYQPVPKVERTCPICDQLFLGISKQVYCSALCGREGNNRAALLRAHGGDTTLKVSHRTCPECGLDFTIIRGYQSGRGAPSKWCSRTCGERANRRKHRPDAKRKRRAQKRGAHTERIKAIDIFNRDGWRCGICGKPTKRDAKVPEPDAPVLDHIVALARGGTHQAINVQCAHFLCNSHKSADGPGQLRLFG